MTSPSRILRLLTAALAAVCLALPGAVPVHANGLGDLYVAVPEGVDETHLATASIVTTVELAQGPVTLAFTPDGRTLYAGDGERHVYRIDIESISLADTITLDANAAAIAHPRGDALLLASPEQSEIAVLLDGDDIPAASIQVPGPADLLAADRREARAIAAQAGKPWAAVIAAAGAGATEVGVGGEVTAVAVARDEGAAYVTTTNPDQVVRVDLATAAVTWTAPLDGTPTGVTAIAKAAVVAIGSKLVRAADGKAATWSTVPQDITGVVASDEGQFVYASTADTVYAVGVADPSKKAAELALEDATPAALAPVPRASSLVKDGGDSAGGTGNGTGDGTGNGTGDGTGNGTNDGTTGKTPATDTEGSGAPLFTLGGRDVTPFLLTAAVVTVVVLFGSRLLFKRLTGES